MKKKVSVIVGTRPELIRFAPIIHEMQKLKFIDLSLIHTGQHYTDYMNKIFFDELNIPKPDINLSIGEFDPNKQIGEIIIKIGELLSKEKSDILCVWGDTNSSLAAAIAANKKKIRLCHLEAGCRSHDYRMQEEYNRIIIDHLSDLLFALSKNDQNNLLIEKMHGKIVFSGDPLYDVFLLHQKKAVNYQSKYTNLINQASILLTLHRSENVDNKVTLKKILTTVNNIKSGPIIFPVHPRTQKMIRLFGLNKYLESYFIKVTPPLGYYEILKILHNCDMVITDSGGLQKEAFFAKKLCLTLRKSTEWVDTERLGVNIVLDPEKKTLQSLPRLCNNSSKLNRIFNRISENPYGNGSASKSIVNLIVDYIS